MKPLEMHSQVLSESDSQSEESLTVEQLGTASAFRRVYGASIGHAIWFLGYLLPDILGGGYSLAFHSNIKAEEDRMLAMMMVALASSALVIIMSTIVTCRSPVLHLMMDSRRAGEMDLIGKRRLLLVLWVLGPGCLVTVPWWLCRLIVFQDVPWSCKDLPPWMFGQKVFAGICFWLLASICAAEVLAKPWLLSKCGIADIIHKIETGEDIDWDEMILNVWRLDETLERLWSPQEAGLTWLLLVLVSLLVAVCGVAHMIFGMEGVYYAPLGSMALVSMMYSMSRITSACQSTFANGWSIPAAAQRYLARQGPKGPKLNEMGQEQRQAHARFMVYIFNVKMGVEIFGLLITVGLVSDLFVKLLIAIPTMYGFLQHTMKVANHAAGGRASL